MQRTLIRNVQLTPHANSVQLKLSLSCCENDAFEYCFKNNWMNKKTKLESSRSNVPPSSRLRKKSKNRERRNDSFFLWASLPCVMMIIVCICCRCRRFKTEKCVHISKEKGIHWLNMRLPVFAFSVIHRIEEHIHIHMLRTSFQQTDFHSWLWFQRKKIPCISVVRVWIYGNFAINFTQLASFKGDQIVCN